MAERDTAARKWLLTINNPENHGLTHEAIKERLKEFKKLTYWCMADEIGEEGTYHTHLYIHCSAVVRYSSVKKRFPPAHIDHSRGTASQNRDYVSKSGPKWEKDKKHETRVEGTFEESGEVPVERQGARNDLADLYSMIKQGMTNFEITEQLPDYMFQLDKIEQVRQMLKDETYKDVWRDLEVQYIYGETGTGKTRGVMEKYGYRNVYRVTDYSHPFDGYEGQDVILFEEFRSSLSLGDMLKYLDGYPVVLPCRYANKQACFTKVYLVTNIPLSEQYKNYQYDKEEDYRAFLRRIGKVYQYTSKGIQESRIELTKDGFRNILEGEVVPFENAKSPSAGA